MQINESAPVASTVRIETAADRELVWEVLTQIDEWPRWNPDVDSAALEGGLGGLGLSLGCRLTHDRLDDPTGRGPGANRLDRQDARTARDPRLPARSTGPGYPRSSSAESWEGLVARVFRTRMQGTLERAMEAGLRHLKREAERRTSEG